MNENRALTNADWQRLVIYFGLEKSFLASPKLLRNEGVGKLNDKFPTPSLRGAVLAKPKSGRGNPVFNQ